MSTSGKYFDKNKRQSLKSMIGNSFVLVTGSLAVTTARDAGSSVLADVEMMIISSRSEKENSLLLKNGSNQTLHIDRFCCDKIVFDERQVSIASLTESGPLTIEPGQWVSFPANVVPLSTESTLDYVLSDSCAAIESKDSVDVNLGGFMVSTDVMVFSSREHSIDVLL